MLNDYNGVGSELPCYVYWGSKNGLSAKPVELPAFGARAVALIDLNRDGLLDLIFPSAWKDPHNPAVPMNAKVYLQKKGRTVRGGDRQIRHNVRWGARGCRSRPEQGWVRGPGGRQLS